VRSLTCGDWLIGSFEFKKAAYSKKATLTKNGIIDQAEISESVALKI